MNRPGSRPLPSQALEDDGGLLFELIELLFFAYRDFVSEPDRVLERDGFGRAHHRVLHFVNRKPGLTVAELLDILKITKQSLNRVLKELLAAGHVEQREGTMDRRQRLLFATAKGKALAMELAALQDRRVRAALSAVPPETAPQIAEFLRAMIDAAERDRVAAVPGETLTGEKD